MTRTQLLILAVLTAINAFIFYKYIDRARTHRVSGASSTFGYDFTEVTR